MLVNDAPETAPRKGMQNLHDLIADYPWLLNPDWQVLSEEKSITKQLREWGNKDLEDQEVRMRYDFLALSGSSSLHIIEIKRTGHAVELEDIHRLQKYREHLDAGTDKSISMVLVSGPKWATGKSQWQANPDLTLLEWVAVHDYTESFYKQYKAVLEADIQDRSFSNMEKEVARTKEVLEEGAYRGSVLRSEGLGPQYVDYEQGVLGEEDADTL